MALHVRRGNVSAVRWSDRFKPDHAVAASVARFREQTGLTSPVVLFSEGRREDFAFLEPCGVSEFRLGEDVFDTLNRMVHAEGLIMARSTFSYVAALLGEGQVMLDEFYHRPLTGWLVEQWDGQVVPLARIKRHAARCKAFNARIAVDAAALIAEMEADSELVRESAEARWILARARLRILPEEAKPLLLGLAAEGSPFAEHARKALMARFGLRFDGTAAPAEP